MNSFIYFCDVSTLNSNIIYPVYLAANTPTLTIMIARLYDVIKEPANDPLNNGVVMLSPVRAHPTMLTSGVHFARSCTEVAPGPAIQMTSNSTFLTDKRKELSGVSRRSLKRPCSKKRE